MPRIAALRHCSLERLERAVQRQAEEGEPKRCIAQDHTLPQPTGSGEFLEAIHTVFEAEWAILLKSTLIVQNCHANLAQNCRPYEKRQKTMSKAAFIDLFSGAGGLGIGLKKAGFEPLLSVDHDKDSVETLRCHSEHRILHAGISEFIDEIETGDHKYNGVELLAGGPPCQGFCSINPQRRENDPRNSLIDSFLHVASIINPKIVLIENVTGLLSLANGFAIEKIVRRLNELGYKVNYHVLQAAHYGVPQSRWRLFVVGCKSEKFVFPKPTHAASITPNFIRGKELTFSVSSDDLFNRYAPKVTVWDAISDLPPLDNGGGLAEMDYASPAESKYQMTMRVRAKRLYNHSVKNLQDVNIRRVMALPGEGMNWTDLPHDLMPENLKRMLDKYKGGVGAKTRFQRLKKDGIFSTIVTSPDPYWGAFIHPEQNRVISAREAARAQSFDDDIVFKGSLNSQYRQIGNAVPPLMAEAMAKNLMELL